MRIDQRIWLIVAAFALVLAAATAHAQMAAASCETPPAVKEALKNVPGSASSETDRAARIKALRELLQQYPNEMAVHTAYQAAAGGPAEKDREAMIAEYKSLAGKHPNDPLYAYLAARAQIGANTKQIIPELEKAAPAIPAAQLSLVQIYGAPNFRDMKKAQASLEAYMKACPASLDAFMYLRSMEPSDFVKSSATRLRAILAERSDPDSLVNFRNLWPLEFRLKPLVEHEALRKEVAEDLKRLRGIDGGKNGQYYMMLQEGYKLVSDTESTKWAAEQILRVSPENAWSTVRTAWLEQHPYPKSTDPPEKKKEHNEAMLKASAEWVRQWPDNTLVWYDRLRALRSLDHADPAELQAAAEGVLRAEAKRHQLSVMRPDGGSSLNLYIAYIYAQEAMLLDRIPRLIEQGIEEMQKPMDGGLPSDLYSSSASTINDSSQWYGWLTIADIYTKVKEKDRAHEALGKALTIMEKSKPPADSKDPNLAAKQRTYIGRQVEYWSRMGELAQLESRKMDALTFYQNAMLARPVAASTGAKDELAEKARAIWQEMGGSNEGWQAWMSRREFLGGNLAAPAMAWSKTERTLPEFELADMGGAKWRLADLKGKTTLIGIWATW